MASKILTFLGLAGSDSGDVVIESHRKRNSDYMKKIQRLVIPEEDESSYGNGEPAEESSAASEPSVRGYVAVKDDPLTEDIPAPAPEPAAEPAPEPAPEPEARPEKEDERAKHAVSAGEKLTGRLMGFGKSLRRPEEEPLPLVLVKKDALQMLDDIEEALKNGQTVMLDFQDEDPKKARETVTRVVNFVRVHNGAYYTVTKTSLLLTLVKNAVIEWRLESEER